MEHNNSLLKKIAHHFKLALINGLLTILPLTLTIGVFMFSLRIFTNWLQPIQDFLQHPVQFINTIPYQAMANQLFFFALTVIIIGFIVRTLILKQLIIGAEELLFKLPLVRPVYSGIKQLIHAFSIQDKITFKKVVLVEFPRTGVYSLGFLTSELPRSIAPNNHETFYNVFIPTTPNPTSGFLVILSNKDFSDVNLTRQEAMAMVISGGIIQPERFMQK